MNKNQIVQKPRFSVAITTPAYQKLINSTIQDPQRRAQYVASITSAVANNPDLQNCEASSILAGSLLGESMKLSPSPALQHYFLIPFKVKAKFAKDGTLIQPEIYKANFVIGYRGMLQLAIKSGFYRKINVKEVKQNELIRWDPFTEEYEIHPMADENLRASQPTVGYWTMLEYLNGFRKVIYWTKEKMMSHADRYSKAFSRKAYEDIQDGKVPEKDLWKYSSPWYTSFDDMGCKTMLRQLLSKWGVMSIEMQRAFEMDEKIIDMGDKGQFLTDDPYSYLAEPDEGFEEQDETSEPPEPSKRSRKPKESPPPEMQPDEGFEQLSLEDL